MSALEIEHALKMQRREAQMGLRRLRVVRPTRQLELGHPPLRMQFDLVRHRRPPTRRRRRLCGESAGRCIYVHQGPPKRRIIGIGCGLAVPSSGGGGGVMSLCLRTAPRPGYRPPPRTGPWKELE